MINNNLIKILPVCIIGVIKEIETILASFSNECTYDLNSFKLVLMIYLIHWLQMQQQNKTNNWNMMPFMNNLFIQRLKNDWDSWK